MPSLGEAIRCGRTGKGWTQDDLTAVLKVEKVFGWPRGYTLAIIAGEA